MSTCVPSTLKLKKKYYPYMLYYFIGLYMNHHFIYSLAFYFFSQSLVDWVPNSNCLYFYLNSFWECRYCIAGPCGILPLFEVRCIDVINFGKNPHVSQQDRCLRDVPQAGVGPFNGRLQILHYLMSLPFDIVGIYSICLRIDGDLSRNKQQIPNCCDWTIRPNCFWNSLGKYSFDSLHISIDMFIFIGLQYQNCDYSHIKFLISAFSIFGPHLSFIGQDWLSHIRRDSPRGGQCINWCHS